MQENGIVSAQERAIRLKLKNDLIHYAQRCLKIRGKSGEIEPFSFNRAQLHLHARLQQQLGETGKVRAIVLKGRQQGCSSYVGARFYHKVSHKKGQQAFILAHALDATQNLYVMAKRFYHHTPELVKPEVTTSNSKELLFGRLDSGYKLGTAENKEVGRSSTIQLLHGCLGGDTLVYSRQYGFYEMENFHIGDEIMTHTGQYAPISYISKQEKSCLSVLFRTLGKFPLTATPEHRFWTKSGWCELRDLKIGDSIGYPVKKIQPKISELGLPLAATRKHGGGRQYICPDEIYLDYNFGRVVGLYLAEGHIKLQAKYPHNPCYISFTIHRNETNRTIEWLEAIKPYYSSMHVKHREGSLTTTVTIYGNRLASLIKNLCGRVEDKHIPAEWEDYPYEFCKGILHGYITGDGSSYMDSRRVRASSICQEITLPLRDMTASLGYGWAGIAYREGAVRSNRNEQAQWLFTLCGEGAARLAHEIGKPSPVLERAKVTSTKNYAAQTTEISDGYAWLRIRSIADAGVQTVYDFEVNHPDHSYCILHGATHNSEVAFWSNANEHAKGIMQAVPNSLGTEIILESTANGTGNYYHQQWQSAEAGTSEFIPIFLPWYWQDEYRAEMPLDFIPTDEEMQLERMYGIDFQQMVWRRRKIAELNVAGMNGEIGFQVEYPNSPQEAFTMSNDMVYIPGDMVMRARKQSDEDVERYGRLLVGVDPARFGDDRTCIIRRQGRVAFGLQAYKKIDTMHIVGLVHNIITEEQPHKVFVDIGGLGAGIVDRLFELGHRDIVVGVNAGSSPLESRKYSNKRAEMWGGLRQWLADTVPVKIPDSDTLHADLCGIQYSIDSNSRLVMERKEDMKKRGIRSPDAADALCLTFAYPASSIEYHAKIGIVATKIMSKDKKLMNLRRKVYGHQVRFGSQD